MTIVELLCSVVLGYAGLGSIKITVLITIIKFTSLHFPAASQVVVCASYEQKITCDKFSRLHIEKATYGQADNKTCAIGNKTSMCSVSVTDIVKLKCQGRKSCTLKTDEKKFKSFCESSTNSLSVTYKCHERKYTNH